MSFLSKRRDLAGCGESGIARSGAANDNLQWREPLVALDRIVERKESLFESEWLRDGIELYLALGGTLSLEKCLGIPATARWRNSRRNGWLISVASMIDEVESGPGSLKIESLWNTFISRGPYQSWRDEEKPPSYATPMSEALFWATRHNRSLSLSARQIERITGHVFAKKCR